MPAQADPTLEFMAQFADESKWIVKRRIPLFKPHDQMKVVDGQEVVAYSVTPNDIPQIAGNMRRNEKSGIPARLTVGHIDKTATENNQPRAAGYWLNAQPGTFGPDNEPCVYADAYVKPDCAADVKGRPYRSAEYYPATKDIRGVALLTRDPRLDLGTVELYAAPEGAYFYAAPGEFYMAEAIETPKVDDYGAFKTLMERYAKEHTTKPEPVVKPPDVERMVRDDDAVNYARLSAELESLKTQLKSRDEAITSLTLDRDKEQCERMVRTLQAEGYQLKDDTPTLVGKLMKKSADDRAEMVQMIRDYSPKGAPTGPMLEIYQGHVEDDPTKAKVASPSRQQINEITKRHVGDPEGFEKAMAALKNGQATKN